MPVDDHTSKNTKPACTQDYATIPVGRTLRCVDQLVRQALSNGLDVPESRLTGTGGKQVDGLVHPPQGGDINSLPPDDSSRSNTGGVFTGSTAQSEDYNQIIATCIQNNAISKS